MDYSVGIWEKQNFPEVKTALMQTVYAASET